MVTGDEDYSEEVKHAMRHIEELSRVSDVAAPMSNQRRILDSESLPSIRANFNILASEDGLPESTRRVARTLSTVKHVDIVGDFLSNSFANDTLAQRGSEARIAIEDTTLQLQQVLTTDLPAMSVKPKSPTSEGLSGIESCKKNAGFYPRVTSEISNNSTKIRQLADSVGRIEIKRDSSEPYLVGTAFVIDQPKGIIATACHVAYAVGDYDPVSKTWVLPRKNLRPGARIILDFGFTDAHDPQNEFNVTSIAFIPTVNGCDGALLKVDTSTKPLPPALPLSTTDLDPPLTASLDVFSVGYPSRDLRNVTPASRDYFACLRAADPDSAKFVFGGQVTGVELKTGYSILTHIVPTVGGQSGSPIVQFISST